MKTNEELSIIFGVEESVVNYLFDGGAVAFLKKKNLIKIGKCVLNMYYKEHGKNLAVPVINKSNENQNFTIESDLGIMKINRSDNYILTYNSKFQDIYKC